jgi:1-acyl-sn-glycerol-3-phosphate acyltransferase
MHTVPRSSSSDFRLAATARRFVRGHVPPLLTAGLACVLLVLDLSTGAAIVVGLAFAALVVAQDARFDRDRVMHGLVRAITRVTYRVRARGLEHFPRTGAAIVVANHVTYADAFIVGALAPRPIRFVMHHAIYRHPLLHGFLRLCRVIPIAGRSEDPALMERAFEEIDRALARGEVVGIFPEGRLTTDGEIAVFRPGIERVLARRPVPVIPVALRGLWGSWLSRVKGTPMRGLPKLARARVDLVADPPLRPADATAAYLRSKVAELRGPHA